MPHNDSIRTLKDLGSLVNATKERVSGFSQPAEFGISATFAEALKTTLFDWRSIYYCFDAVHWG